MVKQVLQNVLSVSQETAYYKPSILLKNILGLSPSLTKPIKWDDLIECSHCQNLSASVCTSCMFIVLMWISLWVWALLFCVWQFVSCFTTLSLSRLYIMWISLWLWAFLFCVSQFVRSFTVPSVSRLYIASDDKTIDELKIVQEEAVMNLGELLKPYSGRPIFLWDFKKAPPEYKSMVLPLHYFTLSLPLKTAVQASLNHYITFSRFSISI